MVVKRGGIADVEWIVDLPLPCFDLLVQDVAGFSAREEIRAAWTHMIAAQGSGKDMKENLKPLQKLASPAAAKRKDGKALANRMAQIQGKKRK